MVQRMRAYVAKNSVFSELTCRPQAAGRVGVLDAKTRSVRKDSWFPKVVYTFRATEARQIARTLIYAAHPSIFGGLLHVIDD
jgi:hypothetical protein